MGSARAESLARRECGACFDCTRWRVRLPVAARRRWRPPGPPSSQWRRNQGRVQPSVARGYSYRMFLTWAGERRDRIGLWRAETGATPVTPPVDARAGRGGHRETVDPVRREIEPAACPIIVMGQYEP